MRGWERPRGRCRYEKDEVKRSWRATALSDEIFDIEGWLPS
jgi:hypothetical protein